MLKGLIIVKGVLLKTSVMECLETGRKDHGYSWIVFLSSFFIQFISYGQILTVGIWTVAFLEEFEENTAKTSIPGSLMTGTKLVAGNL